MKANNNSGFSLVEIIVAAAILSGLSLAFITLNKNMTQSKVKNDVDSELLLINNEIVAILSNPVNCLATFGGVNASTGSVNDIKYNGVSKFSTAGGPYGNAQVKILSYQLSTADPAVSLATNTTQLLVNFERKNAQGAMGNLTRRINLYVEVDASSNITKCRSLSSASTDIWTRGAGSDIYYSENVGIGTSAPTEKLDIAGNMKTSGDITAGNAMSALSFTYTSDRKMKKNITEIKDPLKVILNLHGVNFDWKANNERDVGFIAQEVKVVVPEIVKYSETREIHTVDYAKVVPILVEAMKVQQKKIDSLEKEIKKLKKE